MAAAHEGAVADECVGLVLARLAAEEKDALEAIKGDLCQWLANPDVLALDIAPASFLQVLDSGVPLCRLASLIQEGATRCLASGKKLSVKVPMVPLAYNSIKSSPGSAMFQACARDNASHFIEWCRGLGVGEAVLFESVGLVEHRDEKRVILCLLDVARFAEKVGVTPPQLVSLEKEIDRLEAQSLDPAEREDEITSNKTELSLPEKEDVEASHQPNEDDETTFSRVTEAEEKERIETEKESERIETEKACEGIKTEAEEEKERIETEAGEEEKMSRKRCRDSDKKMNEEGDSEVVESPPIKRPKRGSHSETPPPPQQPLPDPQSQRTHHRRTVQRSKKKQTPTLSPGKKVDEKVLDQLA